MIRALRGVSGILLRYMRETYREDREVSIQSGSKHRFGSTELMYLPRKFGGRGLKSSEEEYILTKIKAAAKLYSNLDPVMQVDKRYHCTKNWIYTKFTQCKFGAKKCKLRLNKRAKMVNTAFALKLTPPCNWQANAVFTIFSFNFPLVCTFLHHIYTE